MFATKLVGKKIPSSLLKVQQSKNLTRQFQLAFAKRNLNTVTKTQKNSHSSSSNFAKKILYTGSVAAAALLSFNQLTASNNDNVLDNQSPKKDLPKVSVDEFIKHDRPKDCWVVINGTVYDLTRFIDVHPGGPNIIEQNCGKDVSKIFNPLHAPDVIQKYIDPKDIKGTLDGELPESHIAQPLSPGETADDVARKAALRNNLPDLESLITLYDFEYLASKILSKQAWCYYSSAAEDEITHRENHNAYHRIFFKPRVLIDVVEANTSTEMLGEKQDVPFYVSATALCKLGNPEEGEKDIARGCGMGDFKMTQMISTLASCSLKEVSEAKTNPDQVQWFQLYVNSDRKITDNLLKEVEKLGMKAIFVTVDAPSLGRREKDMQVKFADSSNPQIMNSNDKTTAPSKGASRSLSTFIDASLSWKDVQDIKSKTKLPLVIKGIQTKEDALKAAEIGVNGIVLSNHGGRQLDCSRAPIEILAEVMPALKEKGVDTKKDFQVFVDGGVRRGTDVLKALCMGATGVGLGRPALYANSTYGKDGINKLKHMLQEEVEMSMRLLGVTSIDQLDESYIDTSSLNLRSVTVPRDNLYSQVYEPRTHATFQNGADSDDSDN